MGEGEILNPFQQFIPYAFFWGLAWGIAYYLSRTLFLRKGGGPVRLRGFFGGSLFASWLGAKSLFILVSEGRFDSPLMGDLSFWLGGGGFVFYGGFMGVAFFAFFYSIIFKRLPFNQLFLFLPPLALGHSVGRVGCFFVGCCHGRGGIWSHPVQLYEALGLAILGLYLLKRVDQEKEWGRGMYAAYFVGHSSMRFLLEFLRGDSLRGPEVGGLSIAQWISMGFLFLGVALLARGYRARS